MKNNFYQHFELENEMLTENFSFLYWRQSPRGRVKFGITHLPWERLRMQQQGTDEEIQFDHIWMTRYWAPGYTKVLEDNLKSIYKGRCLHNRTKRAGHTEWYENIDLSEFESYVNAIVASWKIDGSSGGGDIKKICLNKPYTATKSSECPFGSPSNSRHMGKSDINAWAAKFWNKLGV